jgi:hypothetical protein
MLVRPIALPRGLDYPQAEGIGINVGRDFIDAYLEWSENTPSPYLFRLWAGISAVAGALERRVWVKALSKPTFPNLYILLVASPGVGKGIIDDTAALWGKVPRLKTAPDSVTSASMLDSLIEAKRTVIEDGQVTLEYHSLLIAAEEFGVLVPSHDLEFLSRLNKIYTNPESFRVRRKYIKEEIDILRPQLNILAGTQPGYLASLLPEEAWVMGFTQRLIMVYAQSGPSPELFKEEPERDIREESLVRAIEELSTLSGQFRWEPDAANALRAWDLAGGLPKPQHLRLVHYIKRRTQFMIKLMMISAASRRSGLIIIPFDFERAFTWLRAAEAVMPDVFREMTQKSDSHVLQELVYTVFRIYMKEKQRPVHKSRLWAFLQDRAPSEKIPKLIELAEQSAFITRVDNDYFIPKRDPGEVM